MNLLLSTFIVGGGYLVCKHYAQLQARLRQLQQAYEGLEVLRKQTREQQNNPGPATQHASAAPGAPKAHHGRKWQAKVQSHVVEFAWERLSGSIVQQVGAPNSDRSHSQGKRMMALALLPWPMHALSAGY